MGIWIKADGTVEQVKPARGKKFKLDELQKLVGGYIELVATRSPKKTMYVNEDGIRLNLPINERATELIDPRYITMGGVRGDAIICERGEG